MANLSDQAGAIWKALDDMLQKDPEGYQRFIQEQMAEGRQSFGKESGQGPSSKPNLGPGSSKSGNVKPFPNMESLLKPLEHLLAGGRLQFDSKVQDSRVHSSSQNNKPKHTNPRSQTDQNQKGPNIGEETVPKPTETKEKKLQLLDDSIGTSIIGTIVPKTKATGTNVNNDDDEDEVITEIQLPSNFSSPSTKIANNNKNKNGKPLIEEL